MTLDWIELLAIVEAAVLTFMIAACFYDPMPRP